MVAAAACCVQSVCVEDRENIERGQILWHTLNHQGGRCSLAQIGVCF